jgi:arylsulfatase A-like enzyme
VQLLLLAVVILLIVGVVKVGLYKQPENQDRQASKQNYLKNIAASSDRNTQQKPNIVFVLYDDLGYSDFSHTGSKSISTPSIDQLAQNGVVLNQFYSPAPVCTPSRFGYLTGRHAERGGLSHVVFPSGHNFDRFLRFSGLNVGIPSAEITIAEIVRAAGYNTGLIGKWHLGDTENSIPNAMGFDYFYGSLYSNDMEPFALYENQSVAIQAPVDQTLLSEHYSKATANFINSQKDSPFFLYLAHNFPHLPLFVRDSKLGESDGGLYGDVVEELDEGIAHLVKSLKAAGVYDNTLIIITSDNGPWYQGNPGNARGRKGETFEGGMHVPFVAHWPKGVCQGCELNGLASGIDLLPTILDILDLPAPDDRIIDGRSILQYLQGKESSPHEYIYYLSGKLLGVRNERFKYMPKRPVPYNLAGRTIGISMKNGPWLFDLKNDPNESYDVSARFPEEFKQLQKVYNVKSKSMQENLPGWKNTL